MEGAARGGGPAGAEHSRVLAHAEELLDDPGRAHRSASKVPRQFKAATHVAPPTATLAASSEEAPVVPDAEADGTYACPECGKGVDTVVRWHLHRAACHGVLLPRAVFPEPTNTDQFRQDFRGVWFRLSREGHFFEMTEANRSRSARKLGEDVVVPLLVKGDKIRLKDGTRLFYGEGFDTESEPEVDVPAASTDPIPSYGGGRRGMEMRDDPDEQEQIRRLRERGSHTSAPVTPPKAAPPRKVGRNKASSTLEPENTPPRPPSGPRAEARAAGVEFTAGAASTGGAQPAADPPGSPSCSAAGSSTDGAPGFAISVMESTRRKQTTASISRLAALTWAPGVAGIGRPVPGARTT